MSETPQAVDTNETDDVAHVESDEVPELVESEGDSLPSVDSPLSPEDELDELRDYRTETGVIAREITNHKAVVEERKRDLKKAKDALEEAQDSLAARALKEQHGDEDMPLFNQGQDVGTSGQEDPWRAVTTEDMGLPSGIAESLASADKPIHTAVDIVDWTAELGKQGVPNPLCSIAGIGKSKAELIDSSLQACIAANPPGNEGPLSDEEQSKETNKEESHV